MQSDLLSSIMLSDEERDLANEVRIWLLCDDIDHTKDQALQRTKRQWLHRWMELFTPGKPKYDGLIEFNQYRVQRQLRQVPSKLRGGALLVELLSFTPYVLLAAGPLSGADDSAWAKSLKKCRLEEDRQFEVLGASSAERRSPASSSAGFGGSGPALTK